MPVVTNGRIIYVEHPTGYYEPGVHTKYVEEQLDTDAVPLDGGILVKVLALSSDPYMRHRMRDESIPLFAPALKLSEPLDNVAVGKVIRSEDPAYSAGDYVAGYFTFENYSVYPGKFRHSFQSCKKIKKIPGTSLSAYAGLLGLAGQTAYQGWNMFGKEKAKNSKTLFISVAAGAVGSFLLEYVKAIHPHLKVIASAGTKAKIDLLRSLGADVAFNYKEQDVASVLAEHGPIDIYWDNTAGPTADAALCNMNTFGQIIACGAISSYNEDGGAVKHFEKIFERCLSINGFLINFGEEGQKALLNFDEEVPALIQAGKIHLREHRFEGLRSAENALRAVHTGENLGKAVIIVDEEGGRP
ncbi:hypothetical protein QCA50_011071 [Cerrena zonata]|uniref:Enoyl reductase (ER) domain-containing protein n=1 Tax=Cerrena zonata TaxID=2478898 RepID=A0AAW0G7V2_9APHY